MPGSTAGGRAIRGIDLTTKAAGAEGASTSHTGVEVAEFAVVRLTLVSTAVSGTSPTLDVTVETSSDNGVADAWRSVGTFTQVTGVTSARKSFGGCDRWVRTRSVIGGTASPTVTYSVSGEAV